jgi:hypothetical protein
MTRRRTAIASCVAVFGLILLTVFGRSQQTASAPLSTTHGKSLSGKQVILPAPDHTRTLIIAGFTKGSSVAVKAWWEKSGALCQAHPEVACYRVAVLEEVPGFIRGMILGGMRHDIPANEQDSFVTVFENEAAWKQIFGFSTADDAYMGLFDKNGKMLWRNSGGEKAADSAAVAPAFAIAAK